ncbi:MAG: Transcriptional regulatory protein OmpR [Stenotrophomonas maltophilia]|nr:MAG: Transcriptional regulatory protein OmpR [Stenotrophomonas maltophilia]
MARPDHILVVDDDPEIRQLLGDYLRSMRYEVSLAADGKERPRPLEQRPVDLVVFVLRVPGEGGMTLCRDLRAEYQVPVIMLTVRGSLIDRIIGLEMGADDYLPKPFDPRELLARIKVVLRRAQSFPQHAQIEDRPRIRFAGWELDTRGRYLRSAEGVLLTLAGSDFRLLRLFLDHPNRALSRDFLLRQVFDKERLPFDRSIDVCVSRLRQHLEDNPRAPQMIRTVRNQGYMFTVDDVVAD